MEPDVGQPSTLVATPYRNEPSYPSCQLVCYNDSPIVTEDLWDDSLWLAQLRRSVICTNGLFVCLSHIQYILWDFFVVTERPRNPIEESCHIREFLWAQLREYIQISTGSVVRSQPGLGSLHVPSLTLRSPSPKTVTTIGTAGHCLRSQFTMHTT